MLPAPEAPGEVNLMSRFTLSILIREFNKIQIGQRIEDGYINITQIAKAHHKRVQNWLRLQSTQNLLEEFERQENSEVRSRDRSDLSHRLLPIIVIHGGINRGGTWAHPDIAIQFAQWCNPGFALQVSRWVRQWLTNKQPPVEPIPDSPINTAEVEAYLKEITDLVLEFESLETNLILSLAHCRITHNIIEQRLVDISINKAIDTVIHQQKIKLESALTKISSLRSSIAALEKIHEILSNTASTQTFHQLTKQVELLREQKVAVEKQDRTVQVKLLGDRQSKNWYSSKQECVACYLDYLDSLPSEHPDKQNLTNQTIALRLGCEETTVRIVKKKRGIAPRSYKSRQTF